MNLSKTFAAVQYASRKLLALNDEKINQILLAVADAAEERTDFILAENRKDLNRMDASNPKYDRLMLTPERLKGIATDIRKVAKLPSPVGRVQKQGIWSAETRYRAASFFVVNCSVGKPCVTRPSGSTWIMLSAMAFAWSG